MSKDAFMHTLFAQKNLQSLSNSKPEDRKRWLENSRSWKDWFCRKKS